MATLLRLRKERRSLQKVQKIFGISRSSPGSLSELVCIFEPALPA